ncbi:hypothetical protein QBC34DRAFT_378541 [Podospora aff. communis PSN243]|uniref:Uncharacterized protein n=1 Tax=Podospora aff. communis PSN243 TaxID=3040156 RepID=A0AAV9GV10_9PEZI|nr:hypothetical protein QBC34DRAFT_378541 [Podospora aff. communis PSN243]
MTISYEDPDRYMKIRWDPYWACAEGETQVPVIYKADDDDARHFSTAKILDIVLGPKLRPDVDEYQVTVRFRDASDTNQEYLLDGVLPKPPGVFRYWLGEENRVARPRFRAAHPIEVNMAGILTCLPRGVFWLDFEIRAFMVYEDMRTRQLVSTQHTTPRPVKMVSMGAEYLKRVKMKRLEKEVADREARIEERERGRVMRERERDRRKGSSRQHRL